MSKNFKQESKRPHTLPVKTISTLVVGVVAPDELQLELPLGLPSSPLQLEMYLVTRR